MPRTVTDLLVDFAKPLGTIRPLHGVNFGPRYGSIDLSDRFRAAGFPSIRLHDCPAVCRDAVDIHCVFPLFHVDETDPAYALHQIRGWPSSIPVTFVVSSRGERQKQFNTRVNLPQLVQAVEGVL